MTLSEKPKGQVASSENQIDSARPTRRRTRLKNWLGSSATLLRTALALNRARAGRARHLADKPCNTESNFSTGGRTLFAKLTADARNAAGSIALVRDIDWPPHAVTIRGLDADEREVHSEVKGGAKG